MTVINFKIIHVSDIHIRNKRRERLRDVIGQLHRLVENEKAEDKTNAEIIVVICGDLFHYKNNLSGKDIEDALFLFRGLIKHATTIVVPGNHDIDSSSSDAPDLIGPVVDALKYETGNALYYMRRSNIYSVPLRAGVQHESNPQLIVCTIAPDGEIPNISAIEGSDKSGWPRICLFHEDVDGSSPGTTRQRFSSARLNLNSFGSYDVAFGGHLHSFQQISNRAAYCGALMQQSVHDPFGIHGATVWSFEWNQTPVGQTPVGCHAWSRTTIPTVRHVVLNPPRGLFKCVADSDVLTFPQQVLAQQPDGAISIQTTAMDLGISKEVAAGLSGQAPIREKNLDADEVLLEYKACSDAFITHVAEKINQRFGVAPTLRNIPREEPAADNGGMTHKNIKDIIDIARNPHQQNLMIREMVSPNIADEICAEHNKRLDVLQALQAQDGHLPPNIAEILKARADDDQPLRWRLVSLSFSNFFCFGENNFIDFGSMRDCGVNGIVAMNRTGKTAILDVLMFLIYDRTSRPCQRNSLVRRGTSMASASIVFEINGVRGEIRKQVPATARNASAITTEIELGGVDLSKKTIVETKSMLQKLLGSYDAGLMISFSTQERGPNFIYASQLDRKKILAELFNLDNLELIEKQVKSDLFATRADAKALINTGTRFLDAAQREEISVEIDKMDAKLNEIRDQHMQLERECIRQRDLPRATETEHSFLEFVANHSLPAHVQMLTPELASRLPRPLQSGNRTAFTPTGEHISSFLGALCEMTGGPQTFEKFGLGPEPPAPSHTQLVEARKYAVDANILENIDLQTAQGALRSLEKPIPSWIQKAVSEHAGDTDVSRDASPNPAEMSVADVIAACDRLRGMSDDVWRRNKNERQREKQMRDDIMGRIDEYRQSCEIAQCDLDRVKKIIERFSWIGNASFMVAAPADINKLQEAFDGCETVIRNALSGGSMKDAVETVKRTKAAIMRDITDESVNVITNKLIATCKSVSVDSCPGCGQVHGMLKRYQSGAHTSKLREKLQPLDAKLQHLHSIEELWGSALNLKEFLTKEVRKQGDMIKNWETTLDKDRTEDTSPLENNLVALARTVLPMRVRQVSSFRARISNIVLEQHKKWSEHHNNRNAYHTLREIIVGAAHAKVCVPRDGPDANGVDTDLLNSLEALRVSEREIIMNREALRQGLARCQHQERIVALQRREEILKIYQSVLCPKGGIPYHSVKRNRYVLEATINKLLTEFTDFTISIDDEFGINICSAGSNSPIELASGYQKFTASVAVRIAFQQIIPALVPDCLVIDEGFGCLDAENLPKMRSFLATISKKVGMLLVVTHVDDIQLAIDNRIYIGQGAHLRNEGIDPSITTKISTPSDLSMSWVGNKQPSAMQSASSVPHGTTTIPQTIDMNGKPQDAIYTPCEDEKVLCTICNKKITSRGKAAHERGAPHKKGLAARLVGVAV